MPYTRVNWENLPSTNTPVNATNLNKMDLGIKENNNVIGGDAYSSSSTYNVGDYCIYDNTLYQCNTKISTAEAWNSSHWTEVNIIGKLEKFGKNIIVAKVSGTTTITTQGLNTSIVGYTQADKVGTLLSVTNNGVVIPAGVSKVLISGQVRFDDLPGNNRVFVYLNRIRGTNRTSTSANSSISNGNTITLPIAPIICSCQQGDYFNLSIQNNATGGGGKVDGTIAGSVYSFLTVEVIA